MKNSVAYKFVDRNLEGLTEWIARLAELLALTALYFWAAERSHSWLVAGLGILLLTTILAHLVLGFHRALKHAAPEEAKRTEAGENDLAVMGVREKVALLAFAGVVGMLFGAGTAILLFQLMIANSR